MPDTGPLTFSDRTDPTAPAAGKRTIYSKTAGVYWRTASAVKRLLTEDDITTGGVASTGDFKFVGYGPIGALALDGSGDFASTPDNAALDITGNIDVRAAVRLPDFSPAIEQTLVSKWGASGQRSYLLTVHPTNGLTFYWSSNGSVGDVVSGSLAGVATDGGSILLRATLDLTNLVKFYWKAFSPLTYMADLALDTGWTLIASPADTLGLPSIFNSTTPVQIGAANSAAYLNGTVFGVVIENGYDGAGTAVANPDFGIQTHPTTAFADAAGRTWTMNGNAYLKLGSAAPSGWLWAMAQEVSEATETALFAKYGYNYGKGAPGFFKMPDGTKFVRGAYLAGAGGGAETHAHGGLTGDSPLSPANSASGSVQPPRPHNHVIASDSNLPPYIEAGVLVKT